MEPAAFEAHRSRLMAIAYRMLASVSGAEDMVQETWLRWTAADDVDHPSAWLGTVCTRLCLDELRSARVRREQYVGPWLPEPWMAPPEPGLRGESVGMAFLLLLERLTARQRAAWLLREVFEDSYAHVARVLDTSEANVRQLVRRARTAIEEQRPRFEADPERHAAVLLAFRAAVESGDRSGLERVLARDVTFVGDGGGEVAAARRPVRGHDRVARLLLGLAGKLPEGATAEPVWVNGSMGVLIRLGATPVAVTSFEVGDGRVQRVFNVVNPQKLRGFRPAVPRP